MRSKKENIELITNLSNANGISGFEDEVAILGRKAVEDYCEVKEDSLRNVYINLKSNTNKKPKVWLDAHSDEVGFIIQAIKQNGTMNFLPIGGWNPNHLLSNKVRVCNKNGKYIPGVIAAKPVHFTSQQEKNNQLDYSQMVIDVGAVSKDDLINNFNIGIASPVVADVDCVFDEQRGLFIGKAFDCRIGVASLLETINQIKDQTLNVDIVATLSVQEEVGARGAMAAVQNIDADIAIVFEGCPADDTFQEPHLIQAAITLGPMLRHFDQSMITNPRFMKYAIEIAQKHNIPIQESVRSGGGTNARFIHASRYGVPTIVIGIPVRYIHSHHGIVSYHDYLWATKLAKTIIENIDLETINSF